MCFQRDRSRVCFVNKCREPLSKGLFKTICMYIIIVSLLLAIERKVSVQLQYYKISLNI